MDAAERKALRKRLAELAMKSKTREEMREYATLRAMAARGLMDEAE